MAERRITEQRGNIKCCVLLDKPKKETLDLLKRVYGNDCLTKSKVYQWYDRFVGGRISLEDDDRSGRPKTSHTQAVTDKLMTLLDKDRRVTVNELACALDISHGSVCDILHNTMGMTRVCARWVPRLLTSEQCQTRVTLSSDFLTRIRKQGRLFMDRIVTMDETWVHFYDPEGKQASSVWKTSDEPSPVKAKVTKSMKKIMFVIFFDNRGVVLAHAVESGRTINAKYYSKILRRDLKHALQKKRPENIENLILHQDNAPAHRAESTQNVIDNLGWTTLAHPPYSPDLAPCDFALFPHIKSQLQGQRFETRQQVITAVHDQLHRLDVSYFLGVFDTWVHRLEKCILLNGGYFEKM